MARFAVRCLYCGREFIMPQGKEKFIVSCPYCGFLQVYLPDEKNLTVPTHIEEETLLRKEGIIFDEEGNIEEETTIMQPSFNLDELPLPPGLNLTLEVIKGNDRGKIFHIRKSRVKIGRKDVDIPLDDIKVSRKHAVIEAITRENIFLRDLASKNGTYLNGVLVFTRKLKDGDIIKLGDTEIKVNISFEE